MGVVEDERDERLLRAAEVAEALNISKAQVYKLLQAGKIAAVRMEGCVRVKPSDVRAYVRRCRRGDFEG